MAISYGELAEVGAMTNKQLKQGVKYLEAQEHLPNGSHGLNQDGQDRLNAMLTEMEQRGLPRP